MSRFLRAAFAALLLAVTFVRPAPAGDIDVVLNKLVEKGILTSADAQEIRNELGGQAKQREDQQKAAAQEAVGGTVPKWTQAITWSGDMRLRDESIWRPRTPDRRRERIRLRLGIKARVGDHLESGLRLATASALDPISTNQTMTSNFDKKGVFLDQAWIKYTNITAPPVPGLPVPPVPAKPPAIPWSVWGGKFDLPFFSTSLVWDPDLTPEGVALALTPARGPFALGLTAGIFPLNELRRKQADPFLWGAQAGTTWSVARGDWRAWRKNLKVRAAAAWYEFDHLAKGLVTSGGSRFGNTALPASTADMTILAHPFEELNVTAEVSSVCRGRPLRLQADFARNTAIGAANQGHQLGARWGKTDVPWAWEIGGFYQRLERDAVVGQFTDSDFGEGGTDRLGYAVFASLGTVKNSTLGAKWFSTNGVSRRDKIRRLQVDWVTKF